MKNEQEVNRVESIAQKLAEFIDIPQDQLTQQQKDEINWLCHCRQCAINEVRLHYSEQLKHKDVEKRERFENAKKTAIEVHLRQMHDLEDLTYEEFEVHLRQMHDLEDLTYEEFQPKNMCRVNIQDIASNIKVRLDN